MDPLLTPSDTQTAPNYEPPILADEPYGILVNAQPPLGLPVGSVRAILALFIVIFGLAFLGVAGILVGGEALMLVLGAFVATIASVAERYFGSRDGSNS